MYNDPSGEKGFWSFLANVFTAIVGAFIGVLIFISIAAIAIILAPISIPLAIIVSAIVLAGELYVFHLVSKWWDNILKWIYKNDKSEW